MLIISDVGAEVVNSEQTFSICVGVTQDGMDVLVAYGPGINVPIAGVGDRPQRALAAVVKAHREGWKVLDLQDVLGERPNLSVVKRPGIVLPGNGQG